VRHRGARALIVLGACAAVLGTLAVIAAGFALSFDAIRAVGDAAGIRASIAWMLPVSVDGAMMVATITAIVLRTMHRPVWYPWLVVCVGIAVSIWCNSTHAGIAEDIELTIGQARAVSAIPAVTLALSVHLLITLALAVLAQPQLEPEPEPEPVVIEPDMPELDVTAEPEPQPEPDGDPVTPESAGGIASGVAITPAAARTIVRSLRTTHPDMDLDEIARLVGRSKRQAARYLEPSANGSGPSA
jgi:hypothetical protein